MIHCYKCGIEIEPNAKNTCFRCLNNETDIKRHLKTSMAIETCRGCQRYFQPPKGWKAFAWGSQDLLIFLLSRNKTLKGLNIVDSNFIYTEEHSMRMIIEIKAVQDGIEQDCILRYNIKNMQCPECMRSEAKQYWKALVQLRQRPHHKRTFLYIEQLILKHKAHLTTSNIKERKDGIDFYYQDRQDAVKMVEFLSGYCGTRVVSSSRLISEDDKNNTANKKFTFSVGMLPFCKDDFVYLAPGHGTGLGSFVLVSKVRSTVTFFDPITRRTSKLTAKNYYANEDKFKILIRSTNFQKYRALYARPIEGGLYEATLTVDDITLHDVVTDFKIRDNDIVCGYNLVDANFATDINLNIDILPVRVFNNTKRNWKLKSEKVVDDEFQYFIDDVANDKEMLSSICVFDEKDELVENIEAFGI